MEKTVNSVQTRLLVPIVIFLATLLLSFFAVMFYIQYDNLYRNSKTLLTSVDNSITQSLTKQREILLLLSDRIVESDSLVGALKQQDRNALYRQSQDGFDRIRMVHSVTHFYFHDLGGVNVLRLHQPERFGDRITRFTMQETLKTGSATAGLELGPLGTITMRLVRPVLDGATVVGYLELGKELEVTMRQVEELLSIPMVVLINKNLLNQDDFLSNSGITGRSADWDRYPSHINYYMSSGIPELAADLGPIYDALGKLPAEASQIISLNNIRWRLFDIPLNSVSGDELGRIVLFQNIDAQVSHANQLTLSFFFITLIIVSLATYAFSLVLRRVDSALLEQRKALTSSEAGLKEAQAVGRIGNWTWDYAQRTLILSDELIHILELDEQEELEHFHQLAALVHESDRNVLSDSLQRLDMSQEAFTATIRLALPAGRQKHVQFRCRCVFDKYQRPAQLVGTVQDVTEIIEANDQLVESKEAYQQLIESTDAIPWKLNPENWQFTYVGPQAQEVLGYELSVWHEEGFWRDHIHPQDIYKLGLCKQQLQISDSYRFEFRLKHKQGQYIWFSTDVSRLQQRDDKLILQGFMFDISERQKQEIILREIASAVAYNVGQHFLSQLIEQIQRIFNSHYIFIASLSKDQSSLSTTVFMQDGVQIDNMSFHVKQTPHEQALLQRSCVYGSDLMLAFPDCHELDELGVDSYVGRSLVNSQGIDIGLIAVMNRGPMSDLRIVEEVLTIFAVRAATELEQSHTRKQLKLKEVESEQILKAVLDGVITIDDQGIILTMNKAAEEMFEWPADQAIGKNVKMLMPELYAINHDKYLQDYLQSGEAKIIGSTRELEARAKGGRLFPIRLSVSEMDDEITGKRRFIGTVMDLTQVKEQETILRRTQKMDAVGKLTGGLAHDYNNILGIVMGYVELLDQMLDPDSNLRNYTKEIYKASERGSKLAKKLLSFSRNVSKERKVCNINELLKEQKEMLETTLTTRIPLILSLMPDIWQTELDPNEFEDAILNMTLNASHAMAGQGELIISTSNVSFDEHDASVLELDHGDFVHVSVQDNGSGMDDDTQSRIFEPFYSTKGEQGTGLGLSSVYGFVKRSKGAITVNSAPGKGTCFHMYFPRAEQPVEGKNTQDQSAVDTSIEGRESILVVDDEPALAELMSKILQDRGYTTYSANDGQQALNLLINHDVHLVISDVVMPKMDGYALADNIKARYPEIAVMLVSGYDDRRQQDNTLNLDVMSKPYSNKALLTKVRAILDAG